MKRPPILCALLLLALLLLPLRAVASGGLKLLSGGTLELESLRGQQVLLAFFADFCAPCKEEVPHLKALEREFGGAVALLAVAHPDSKSEPVAATVRRFGIDYPVVLDPDGELTRRYRIGKMLPTTVLLGETGDELQKVRGMNPAILGDLRKSLAEGRGRVRLLAGALDGVTGPARFRVETVEAPRPSERSTALAARLGGLLGESFAGGEDAPLSVAVSVSTLGSSESAAWRLSDFLGRQWASGTLTFRGGDYGPLVSEIHAAGERIHAQTRAAGQ